MNIDPNKIPFGEKELSLFKELVNAGATENDMVEMSNRVASMATHKAIDLEASIKDSGWMNFSYGITFCMLLYFRNPLAFTRMSEMVKEQMKGIFEQLDILEHTDA